ncbi:MAG TPA: DUF3617 family protein [Methyloradius sp.]
MKYRSIYQIAVAVSVIMMTSGYAEAAPNIKPGLWEITYAVKNPYLPTAQENRVRQCIKPSDIKDDMTLTPEDASNKCHMINVKTTGDSQTWDLSCDGPTKMTGHGQVSFSGDSYKGNSDLVINIPGNKMNMSMTFTGKRLDQCTQ